MFTSTLKSLINQIVFFFNNRQNEQYFVYVEREKLQHIAFMAEANALDLLDGLYSQLEHHYGNAFKGEEMDEETKIEIAQLKNAIEEVNSDISIILELATN